jgi:pyruvyltransferase
MIEKENRPSRKLSPRPGLEARHRPTPNGRAAMNSPLVYFWKPGDGENFGDSLGPAIVNAMLEYAEVRLGVEHPVSGAARFQLTNDPRACPKLITVGSVIQFARPGDTLWGSGVRCESQVLRQTDGLAILATRGRLSAEALGLNADRAILGDPVMLLPRLAEGLNWPAVYRRWRPPGTGSVAVIPNLRQLPEVSSWRGYPWERHRVRILSPYLPWHEVLRRVLECDLVLTTSLHGLILAESYGVPARWIATPGLEEGTFKFRDYFSSTGREFDPAEQFRDLGDALEQYQSGDGRCSADGTAGVAWNPEPLWNAFPWAAFHSERPPIPGPPQWIDGRPAARRRLNSPERVTRANQDRRRKNRAPADRTDAR